MIAHIVIIIQGCFENTIKIHERTPLVYPSRAAYLLFSISILLPHKLIGNLSLFDDTLHYNLHLIFVNTMPMTHFPSHNSSFSCKRVKYDTLTLYAD